MMNRQLVTARRIERTTVMSVNEAFDRMNVIATAHGWLEDHNLDSLELDEDGVMDTPVTKIMDGIYSVKGHDGGYLFDVLFIQGKWVVNKY